VKLSDAIDEALDEAVKAGDVSKSPLAIEADGRKAEINVVDADRIGVRVRAVKVDRGVPVDVAAEAVALPDRARSLQEPVVPLEVDTRIGRAVLRTEPGAIRRREFFDIGLDGSGEIDVQRYRVNDDGDRDRVDWTMTRDQLGRLLDELTTESS